MDLHTGMPVWWAGKTEESDFCELQGNVRCDVAVIGAGITGTLVSHFLIEAGANVVLIDKAQPAEGSTAASTGLLQHEVDTPLCSLIDAVGRDSAVHAYRRGLTAVDEIEAIAEEIALDCGFSRRFSLYFASNWCHLSRLRQEFECRRAHGFPVKFLNRKQLAEVTSIRASGALWCSGDAQIDPYAFTRATLMHSVGRGLRVFGSSEVTAVNEEVGEVRLELRLGQVVAGAAVFASGYEAHRQLPGWPGRLHSTYAAASQPMESFDGWPEGCLIWETARPYFYARQTDDGRAIIGGGDTSFATDHQRDELLDRKIEALVVRFRRLFPRLRFTPDYAWAGTFAETKDGLAYIGRVPGKSKTYAALGYGGNGITFSMIAAKLITDIHLGRPNADEAVFSFGR